MGCPSELCECLPAFILPIPPRQQESSLFKQLSLPVRSPNPTTPLPRVPRPFPTQPLDFSNLEHSQDDPWPDLPSSETHLTTSPIQPTSLQHLICHGNPHHRPDRSPQTSSLLLSPGRQSATLASTPAMPFPITSLLTQEESTSYHPNILHNVFYTKLQMTERNL